MDFKQKYGRYALITGGTSGIGRAIADIIAQKGLDLILVARRQEELNQAQTELAEKYKIEVLTIQADLSTDEGIKKIETETEKFEVGLLVQAAGMEVNGAFEKNMLNQELMVVQLNVIATLKLAHFFVGKMIPRKKGGLLFVSSLSGHMPNPYFANYAGSKSYVLNFGASLYGELKPKGIAVTVLSPGLTNTPMVSNNGVDWAKTPMTAMNPETVAQAALDALGRKFLVVPGAKNKIMATMAKHSPLQMQAKMNEKMMRKAMAKHKL